MPVFQRLEEQMISALRNVLRIDPAKVEYLRPLLSASDAPVQIATLNYDRSIECLATRAGYEVDTGLGAWSGASDWTWGDRAPIRLLKLHGSVDWWYVRKDETDGRLSEESIEVDAGDDASRRTSGLAVIFGQRGKLRSDGPFLAMLRGFDDFLAASNQLVIVGYSFRDDHINASIRRWFNRAGQPRIVIVDPRSKTFNTVTEHDRSFSRNFLTLCQNEARDL